MGYKQVYFCDLCKEEKQEGTLSEMEVYVKGFRRHEWEICEVCRNKIAECVKSLIEEEKEADGSRKES